MMFPGQWWCVKNVNGECDFRRPGTEKGFADVAEHERDVHGVAYVEVPVEETASWDLKSAQEKFADYFVEGGDPITRFPGTQRESILEEAREYITSDRQAQHGRPEDNFANIARFWNAWLYHRLKEGERITSVDVAEMMMLLKKGRKMSNPDNRDNYADEIGYAACAWELHHREELDDGHI